MVSLKWDFFNKFNTNTALEPNFKQTKLRGNAKV